MLVRELDVVGEVYEDKKCDERCDCTADAPGLLCSSHWRYVGEGLHGGVLYHLTCMAFDDNGNGPPGHDCGVGEYF